MSAALNWRSLVDSRSAQQWVKGTELEVALVPGHHSRFALYAVRSLVPAEPGATVAYHADRRHVVRDAFTVSDADVAAGRRPEIVFSGETIDEALAWCEAQPKIFAGA